ncbi:thermonuclease family protein [Methylobacterium sp. GC_Met_2]|uniref:thermonuclease family protein n=1 Tax=Methylobacterium sp. GC_Met_2 TaxID=2937376 RepID=UPI00226B8592|nr:thermonuclease family protein [Methylobacterium sp. GC_Met_2]
MAGNENGAGPRQENVVAVRRMPLGNLPCWLIAKIYRRASEYRGCLTSYGAATIWIDQQTGWINLLNSAHDGGMRISLFLLAWLFAFNAFAFSATVTRIADGDTFTVLADGQKIRVRIFGIDAPEHDQPYGDRAAALLSGMILGQTVEIDLPRGVRIFEESYDRLIGVVYRNGEDVGLFMIRSGDAWAYDWFKPPAIYDDAQRQAAIHGLGLWAGRPVAPWDWRRQHPYLNRY